VCICICQLMHHKYEILNANCFYIIYSSVVDTDPGSGMEKSDPGSGMEKVGSGINIPDPQH
jgi:hypothetical protein